MRKIGLVLIFFGILGLFLPVVGGSEVFEVVKYYYSMASIIGLLTVGMVLVVSSED